MTARTAETRLLYADSSALVKLVVSEPESAALRAYLEAAPYALVTSRLALVEVVRAVGIASPGPNGQSRAEQLLESCLLVDVSPELLRAASRLASREVRTIDAIHLASAQRVGADEVLAYDRRLTAPARRAGLVTTNP
jgi:predicted nucleic acid-binding protein